MVRCGRNPRQKGYQGPNQSAARLGLQRIEVHEGPATVSRAVAADLSAPDIVRRRRAVAPDGTTCTKKKVNKLRHSEVQTRIRHPNRAFAGFGQRAFDERGKRHEDLCAEEHVGNETAHEGEVPIPKAQR
jgi:hypothetical protein